jgi:hypothetical protein
MKRIDKKESILTTNGLLAALKKRSPEAVESDRKFRRALSIRFADK